MKALSYWQPWASLMAFEEKKVETRGWSTRHRGPTAIAATQKEPPEWLGVSRRKDAFAKKIIEISEKYKWGEWYWPQPSAGSVRLCGGCGLRYVVQDTSAQGSALCPRHGNPTPNRPYDRSDLGYGAILAVGNLIDVIPVEECRDDLSEQERLFGNYEDGRYAWFFEEITRFSTPIAVKGNRMLWNWDETPYVSAWK